MAGATIYNSQAAQERHLRAMTQEYFMDAQVQQQQPMLGADAEAAGLGGEGSAAAAADLTGGELVQEAMQSGEMPWGGTCPVLRPSRDCLLRQLRAALHGVSRRALDLGRAKFTGLTLARMLAGISSPAMPHGSWKGCQQYGMMAAVECSLARCRGEALARCSGHPGTACCASCGPHYMGSADGHWTWDGQSSLA
eukprot:GHUV01016805.1.p1 GENE.GHUV01016805.1~~GHUV01016805.1.p1  ORF type:complete len:195 (+),score=57.71 GHUV01016805.1:307-891(+)